MLFDVSSFIIKMIIAFLPIIIFEITGYRRWKRYYGEGSYLRYYFRYGGVRQGTEDHPIEGCLKMAFTIVWLMAFIAYFF